jgi:putative DNA primase/helicase
MFAFSHGDGRNGKGVFHHTIATMLGDYATSAADNLFFISKGDGLHQTSTASLHGARFVLCSEVPEDRRFNEQLLKNMTGGDVIKTRRLYENEWDFKPTCKLFFCGNHKPGIRGSDGAIWSRVKLIPWTVVIPKAERDTALESKLRAELSGILTWAVRGCAAWLASGLGEPPDVESATEVYREESDPFSEFFHARCEFGDSFKVSRQALRRAYEQWCSEHGASPFGARKLADALRRRGVSDGGSIRDKTIGDAPADAWRGVRVLDRSHVAA